MRSFTNIYSIITNNHKDQYLQKLTKIISHNTQITTLKRINPKRERITNFNKSLIYFETFCKCLLNYY